MTTHPILRVRGLSKRFGGVQALSELDMNVSAGHIHGLIGPNGSGKSTAMHLLNGFIVPDKGTFEFAGVVLDGLAPHKRAALGLGRVFQAPGIFGDLTVLENVLVGCHTLEVRARKLFPVVFQAFKVSRLDRALRARCEESLQQAGLLQQADKSAQSLSYGDRKLLDLAKALVSKPRLLLCDEPAAGLSPSAVERLRSILVDLRDKGTTIVLAEHNMELVLGLCDQITALNFGRKIAEGLPSNIRSNQHVIEAYLGGSGSQC